MKSKDNMTLAQEIRSCTICKDQLPLGPRPIISFSAKSKIILISQAPGSVVHSSGIAWADKSGNNLRSWLGVTSEIFYDNKNFAIVPMGFCYPGRGKSGDLPPLKICSKTWHSAVLEKLVDAKVVLLIGKYAQDYYLNSPFKTLTESVRNYDQFLPRYFPLPHPSPRNNIWQAKNEWFQRLVLPELKSIVKGALQVDT